MASVPQSGSGNEAVSPGEQPKPIHQPLFSAGFGLRTGPHAYRHLAGILGRLLDRPARFPIQVPFLVQTDAMNGVSTLAIMPFMASLPRPDAPHTTRRAHTPSETRNLETWNLFGRAAASRPVLESRPMIGLFEAHPSRRQPIVRPFFSRACHKTRPLPSVGRVAAPSAVRPRCVNRPVVNLPNPCL
jgi:hypothetical protein